MSVYPSPRYTDLTVTGTGTFGNITLGQLNSTPIGNITPSSGAFTTLGASGAAAFASTLGVTGAATFGSTVGITGVSTFGVAPQNRFTITAGAAASSAVIFGQSGTGGITFAGNLTVTGGNTITASGGGGSATMANGFVTTPRFVAGNGGTFSWTGSTSPTGFAISRKNFNVSGAPASGTVAYDYMIISSDTVDGSLATGAPNAMRIGHSIQTGAKGSRIGVLYEGSVVGATGDVPATGNQYVAMGSWFRAAANAGGTASNMADSAGVMFGGYDQVVLNSGATFWRGISGREIDVGVETGANVVYKNGLQIVLLPTDAVQAAGGVGYDMGITFGGPATQTAGRGWLTLIGIGAAYGHFPLDTDGCVMEAFDGTGGTMLAAKGIDFSAMTFSSSAFKSTAFEVDGLGNVDALTYEVASTKVVGARRTGWSAPTGAVSRATFDESTVTTAQLAQRVAALLNDLTTHGLIGT
jgi:hypothetical protein